MNPLPIYVAYFVALLLYIAVLAILYPMLREMTAQGIVESETGSKVLAVCCALMAVGFLGFFIFLLVYQLIAMVIVFSSLFAGLELVRVAKPSIVGLVIFVFGLSVGLTQWIAGFGVLYWVSVAIQVVGVSMCFFDEIVRRLFRDIIGEFALPLLVVTMILANILQYYEGNLAQFSEAAFAVGGGLALLLKYYSWKRRGVGCGSQPRVT